MGYLSDAHMTVSLSDNLFGHYTTVYGSGIYSADILMGIDNSSIMVELNCGYEQLNAKHKFDQHFHDAYYITNYLAGVQYNYFQHKNYYVYSGLELDLRTTHQKDYSERHKNRFAYDATFVGVRYGKRLGVFSKTDLELRVLYVQAFHTNFNLIEFILNKYLLMNATKLLESKSS